MTTKEKNHLSYLKYKEQKLKYQKEYYIKNNERYSKYQKENRVLHKKHVFKSYLKKRYNLTPEEFENILNKQEGCCKICGIHFENFNKKFSVDHCHTSGKVRGLLCNNCNTGIGYFKEDVEILKKAIIYLEEYQ